MTDLTLLIEKRLTTAFAPSYLEVRDDSDLHRNHADNPNKAGHYKISIAAACLENCNHLSFHRAIYQVLDDLLPQIHALQIKKVLIP